MPHESGTDYPGVGAKAIPWEKAEPEVWGAIRRASAQRTTIRKALGELDEQLGELDRHLVELRTARGAELAQLADLREDLRREVDARERAERRLDDHLAETQALERAEDRRERREGLRTAGIGAGGAVGALGIVELVKQLLALLAG